MWTLRDGWVIFADGTCVRAISGAQDLEATGIDLQALGAGPDDLVKAFNVDFVLNVGGDPSMDIGGVPFGDPADNAGYVGLSDAIRSGDSGGAYIGSVAENSSLSDALRSGAQTPSPGFDESTYNPNAPGVPSDYNITDVFKAVSGVLAAVGTTTAAILGASRSPSSGQRAPSGAGAPGGGTLAQRIFGMNPGPSGNPPQTLVWGAMLAVGVFLIAALAMRAR